MFSGTNTSDILRSIARVSNIGTVSPYSVASDSTGTIFFLDATMQVRRMGGGQSSPISLEWVDNQLAAIPVARRAYASACVANDIYRLYFSEVGGTTNTSGLWWDERGGNGWSNDNPPVSVEGAIWWFTGTGHRFLTVGAAGSDVKIYEHDLASQSQDLGTTDIECSVTFPDLHSPEGKAIHVNRVGVTCDDVDGGRGTITRTYKPNGSTGTSTISLESGMEQIARYDGPQSMNGAGNGVSARVALTLGMTAGKKIYRVVAEIEPRDHAYDRR